MQLLREIDIKPFIANTEGDRLYGQKYSGRLVTVHVTSAIYKSISYYVVTFETFEKRPGSQRKSVAELAYVVPKEKHEEYGFEELCHTFRWTEQKRPPEHRLAWVEIECARRCRVAGIPTWFNIDKPSKF